MYKKKSYFIVFEGVEGTGKSFQITKLYKNLKKKNTILLKRESLEDVIQRKKLEI